MFINGRFIEIPYYSVERIRNCTIQGPALLLSPTSSVLVKPNWSAHVSQKLIYLSYSQHEEEEAIVKTVA